jgi:uncharacterized DUF497 family protein
VDIAFDPKKDASNRTKHGVSLALAERFDWLTGQVAPARAVDGELRWKMVTDLKGIVYAVIFTRRADLLWIISVRRASRKERREYAT